mgnify:FL=1
MESIDEIIAFLILYFQSRNIHNFGFVGYKVIKNLIIYIAGIKDIHMIRMIFEKMVKQGWFIKRKTKSKTDFLFIYDNKVTKTKLV